TLEEKHTDQNPKMDYRITRLQNCNAAKKAATLLPPGKDFVIFNCGGANAIIMMFYTGQTAYDGCPVETIYNDVKRKNLNIAVIMNEKVPPYIANDPGVFKMNLKLIPYWE
ncbi:MAG TPA: hypothetical protein VI731_05180, partial [Bacteroidia bacterium]|nr:hypothetical protein [Bacteroidia bacterium]